MTCQAVSQPEIAQWPWLCWHTFRGTVPDQAGSSARVGPDKIKFKAKAHIEYLDSMM